MNQGIKYLSACQFNLDQHIREKHTLDKPYPCFFCHKSFARAWSKNRHEAEVHGDQRSDTRTVKSRKTAHGAKMAEQQKQREPRPAPVVSDADRVVEPLKSPDLAQLLARVDNTDLSALLAVGTFAPVPTALGEAASAIDPGLSYANETLEQPPFTCVVHGFAFTTVGEWRMHGHEEHNVLYSVNCPCEVCQTVIRSPVLSA